jgi:hypothetical protein
MLSVDACRIHGDPAQKPGMIKMMTKDKPVRDLNLNSSTTIRALSSITLDQAEIIVQAVRATGLNWDVQTTDDYDGYLSILVTPSISADKETTFFVAGTAQRLELFKAYDDTMTLVASFNDAEDLSVVLLDIIARQ